MLRHIIAAVFVGLIVFGYAYAAAQIRIPIQWVLTSDGNALTSYSCPAGAFYGFGTYGEPLCRPFVTDINGITGSVGFVAGPGISISISGNTITITNTGDTNPGDDVTAVNATPPISASISGGTLNIALNYDTAKGLDVDASDNLYVKAGTGLTYDASGNLSVLFGSTAGTAAEGSKTITISAGTGLTGGGTITIGQGGSVELNIEYPSLSCASGVLTGFDLSNGSTSCVSVDTNPDDDVTGSGTANYIPKWTDTQTLGNSAITDNGTVVDIGRPAIVGGALTVEGSDFKLGTNDGRTVGSKTGQRALVHADWANIPGTSVADTLIINYDGDFEGGVRVAGPGLEVVGNVYADSNLYVTGNLGVGTTSPSEKLHVAGNAWITGSLKGGSNGKEWMRVPKEDSAGDMLALGMAGTTIIGSGESYNVVASNYNANDEKMIVASDNDIHFITNLQNGWDSRQMMVLTSAGNLGIGTTSPSEKLDVAGNVKASKLIDRDDSAYYVDPSYVSVLKYVRLAGPGTAPPSSQDLLHWILLPKYNTLYSRPIVSVEYWDGSAWQPWSDSGMEKVFDNNPYTEVSVDYTHRKFRVVLDLQGGWRCFGSTIIIKEWTPAVGKELNLTIETSADGSVWTTKYSGSLPTSGYFSIFPSNICDANRYVRITVSHAMDSDETVKFREIVGVASRPGYHIQAINEGYGGKVGIGTTTPDSKLHVIGGVCVEGSDSGCAAAAGEVRAQKFTDKDNTTYYVDPANNGTAMKLAGDAHVRGKLSVGDDAEIAGRLIVGRHAIVSGIVEAAKFTDYDNATYYVDPSNTTTAAKLAGPLDMNGNSVINVAGAGYNALGCREVSGTPPSCSAGEYPASLWTDGTTWYALCCKK